MRWLLLASVLLVSLPACSDDSATLVIELGTDYLPAIEFTSVRIEINDGAPRTVPVALGQRFVEGERIAEIGDLVPGPAVVVTTLLNEELGIVASRRNEIELVGNTALLVVIARSCEMLTCPGVEDPAGETECLGRRCVPPECHPGEIAACGGVECDVDSQCSEGPACVSGRCVGGGCLYATDDGACGAGETCDPIDGCVGAPPMDAGPDATPDGGMDSSIDSGMDAGPDADADAMVDACVPEPELCDGLDNDCDPATMDGADETDFGAACDGPDTDSCNEGVFVCDGVGPGLSCDDASGDTIDRCDGTDTDCDGIIDEGLRCMACTYRESGRARYLFCNENRPWPSAEAVCVSAGGHLVTVDDATENTYLRSQTSAINGSTSWYIGYNDMATEASFVWVETGLEGSYANWAPGQPNDFSGTDDCAGMAVSPGWFDTRCSSPFNYICEWR